MGTWKRYQEKPADYDRVKEWYSEDRRGVGLVTGSVSRNLEAFEFDDPEVYTRFKERAQRLGLEALVERVEAGYLEQSPSGGFHWLWLLEGTPAGNTKLAQSVSDGVRKTLIETRGEGGYIIIAPSYGPVHPLGKTYVRRKGSLAQLVTITDEEHESLLALARTFDEAIPASQPRAAERSPGGRARPGDAFNAGATWSDVLRPHGWTEQYTNGEVTYWARPGKDIGVSATTNFGGSDLLYVFTTSTAFDANRSYDKFGAYTVLEHDGDFEAAAAALREKGYGMADFHLTDLGNAERFVADHHGLVRYSPGIGWLIWNGSRWAPDDLGQVYVLAKETVRRILRDLN